MARRLSFAIAQSITIVGWFMSSFLLVALVSVASSSVFRIQPDEQHALSQAFYYAIIAAVMYSIVASLMVITVVGAYRGHYEKEFRLTVSQRTLMLQTIGFLCYLLIGALIFKTVEGWQYLDAVYWSDFTLLTVGIGSPLVPKTHLGRSLLFPYAIGGILTVGLVVGSIRSLVLERGKKKMDARFVEKKRERVLDSVNLEKRTIKVGWKTYSFSEIGLSEEQRREQEFNIMRKIQSEASTRRKWMALGSSTTAVMFLWLVGAFVFKTSERNQEWSYFTGLYFAYTSLLTIGYGDLQPTSNSGKPFFVFWSILAVPTLTILISNMGDTVVKSFSDFTIWAGSLTILPGEDSTRATLRAAARRVTGGAIFKPGTIHTALPPGLLPSGSGSAEGQERKQSAIEEHAMDMLMSHIEEGELEKAHEADEHENLEDRDRHLYCFVLVRELRKLRKDLTVTPPKEYSYQDWAWYLKLIGQDEANADLHRKAKHGKSARGEGEKFEFAGKGDKGEDLTWSWIGTRSPLMGNQTESEWLIDRVGSRLEEEYRNKALGRSEKSPVSWNDVMDRRGDKGEKNGSSGGKDSDENDAVQRSGFKQDEGVLNERSTWYE
jgi:potassium channel subfamily K, other eukaryote